MPPQLVAEPWGLPSVSLSVIEAPIGSLLSTVAYESGASILLPPGMDQTQTVTAEYKDQPAQRVLEELARTIGYVAEYDGQLITFVPSEKALRDFVVIRSGYGRPEVVTRSIQAMLGSNTTVEQLDDRIVVSGDKRALEQARKYAEQLTTGPDGWLLEVSVVRISESLRTQLGIDWNLRGTLQLNTISPGDLVQADAVVSLIAEAVETGTEATLEQSASLYVLEGQQSTLEQGQRIPVPRFSTSPEGTTTTTGFDYISAGFKLTADAQRVPNGVRLRLQPSISNVTGFVQQAPITNESTVQVTAVVESGDWLVITGLNEQQRGADSKTLPGLPAPMFGTSEISQESSTLVIMLQAHRVYSSHGKPRDPTARTGR